MRHAITYHAAAIAALMSVLLPAGPAQAQAPRAQQTGDIAGAPITLDETDAPATPEPAANAPGTALTVPDGSAPEAAEVAAALSREIARMKAETAEVARFAEWQNRLLRTARVDPDEALRQRLPMSECRASVLAPICDELGYLFAPDDTGTAASEESQP